MNGLIWSLSPAGLSRSYLLPFETYNYRGLAYASLGQHKRAIEDYNEAIRLKLDDNDAYYNMACVFALQKNATQACNWLSLAIKRGYNDWKEIKADKDFNNIRSASCFIKLLKELKN